MTRRFFASLALAAAYWCTSIAAAQAPPASEPRIDLSAGVALPQTGPTGTLMSFSVDYQFAAGQPDASANYVWVIERAKGDPVEAPAKLQDRGALQAFVFDWRPTDRPFNSHIVQVTEDGERRRISRQAEMKLVGGG